MITIMKILSLLEFGGPVVWILTTFSLITMTITFIKLWQFSKMREKSSQSIDKAIQLISQGEKSQALLLIQNQKTPRSITLVHSLKTFDNKGLSFEQFQQEIYRFAKDQIFRANNYLRIIEVIANLSPLLGLFGTVLGMIFAFQAMADAGSNVNPAVLSGGIWQALLTTAVGLAVAIPASLIHSFLERKVEHLAQCISNDIEQLFTIFACSESQTEVPNISKRII